MDQRTEAWFAARCGRVTASRIADVMARTKSGYGASRANYLAQLVCERLTGEVAPSFTNAWMEWGTEKEPEARAAYSAKTGEIVEETGFHKHPTLEAGASPDGLVSAGAGAGAGGVVEIKCPNSSTMIEYLRTRQIPHKYILQMQWQMLCTDRGWGDFVAYDPRLGERLQLLIIRVERDPALIAEIEAEVTQFLRELDQTVNELKEIEL
jgi:putative phage-type endonuclease